MHFLLALEMKFSYNGKCECLKIIKMHNKIGNTAFHYDGEGEGVSIYMAYGLFPFQNFNKIEKI